MVLYIISMDRMHMDSRYSLHYNGTSSFDLESIFNILTFCVESLSTIRYLVRYIAKRNYFRTIHSNFTIMSHNNVLYAY